MGGYMEIKGYKVFSEDGINRYGMEFEEGKKYHVDGTISFGNNGNGIHFCKRMEDTFRYFDAMNGNVKVAEVIGSGDIVEFNDEYYGYYEMYAASDLEVLKFLSREEIIEHFLNRNELFVCRFVSLFKLTEEEILLFKTKFFDNISVLKAIAYYQEKDLDVYSRESNKIYRKRKNVGEVNE